MTQERKKELVERPNKTQIKRDMNLLKEQAAYLCNLKKNKLDRIPLEQSLLDALNEYTRIKNTNAQMRHIQFVTKILAEQSELEKIQRIIFEYQNPHLLQKQLDKKVDALSLKLLNNEQDHINETLNLIEIDGRQSFLQALRNAQKEYQKYLQASDESTEAQEIDKNEEDKRFSKVVNEGKQNKKLRKLLRFLLSS